MLPRKSGLLILAAALLTPVAHPAPALPVSIRVDSGITGQGWLFQRLNACYALTAEHVIGTHDRATLVAGMSPLITGRAFLLQRFPPPIDLAVLRVEGSLAERCGINFDSEAALESVVNARARGEMTEVMQDGGTRRMAIRVLDVGPEFLRIAPVNASDSFYQGPSGGLVTVAEVPAGMFLSIDSGVGKVLRYDVAMDKVEAFFRSPTTAAPSAQSQPVSGADARGNLLRSAAGAFAEANVAPLSVDAGPETLVGRGTGPWLGDLRTLHHEWVEIDVRLGGAARAVARLELDSTNVAPARRVRDYEILVRVAESGWIPLTSGTCFADQQLCSVEFAPTRAQFIKLRIHSNWGAADAVGIATLRAYPAL